MTTTAQFAAAVARYAERFHAAIGSGHHVASPLGAWLVLALAAPAAGGSTRDELADVLGMDVESAAAAAGELLGNPHPLVASAAAAWHRPRVSTDALIGWLHSLPGAVERGDLPSQADADEWARRHTLGLIEKFPLDLTPDVVLVLASALATRVSWEHPFELAPAADLGASSWTAHLDRVLRTPHGHGHEAYLARTERAGDVAVHTAFARDGLAVTSVIAPADVPAATVLAAAHEVTIGAVPRRSLFELPLGDGPMWTISERSAQTTARDGREERCTAVLPAWSAVSVHDLGRDAAFGFDRAAAALIDLIRPRPGFAAKQSAVARYTRVGFEAAAVTAIAFAMAAAQPRDGVLRTAELRFGHPFAAVAVATDESGDGPWTGLPVFSAWVTEPENADD